MVRSGNGRVVAMGVFVLDWGRVVQRIARLDTG